MSGNSFGTLFRITTFGESHGTALGVVIDGCPPGLAIDEDFIISELARRKPGQSAITTERKEDETFQILSGTYNGLTTSAPLTMVVYNKDQKPADYNHLEQVYRPSHADYTYEIKYGIRDHRGGGRSSARETVARVLAGAVAKTFLKQTGIRIDAYVSQVKHIKIDKPYTALDLSLSETNTVRCPDPAAAAQMEKLIAETKEAGDSVGGTVSCVIRNVPPGLGEPVFDKLHADLAKAMMSINACKGFDLGSGFEGTLMNGSEHNDMFTVDADQKIHTATNHSGGIQGGISNGEDIYFRCAFKPVSTIKIPQQTVNKEHEAVSLIAAGRHDPCVLPRAVPIVEAMAAIVLADHLLRSIAYTTKSGS